MHATQKLVTAPVTVARTLRDTAQYLSRHGWIQGSYYDQTATCFTPAACLVGALGMVCYGGPFDAPALNFDDPGYDDFNDAITYLDRYVADRYDTDVYSFNDAKGRTVTEVTDLLRIAGVQREREAHAAYPHDPGTLYDCPVCESRCHCTDGYQCVHCTITGETANGEPTVGGAA